MDDLEPRSRSDALAALVNEDLSLMSVEELSARIEALEAEIARINAEIKSKEGSKNAAEAFFRK
ncbi:DUF1192 domain-containing protein [Tepidicaulis sp. LMO-SS28]|uniref:DUF1192 domain-containing protein n=1 Tax=Tepidicaulis sp. LMO-SS28 TaxID=3447455 RepID=UPI003EE02511